MFGGGNDDTDELVDLYKRAGRLYSEAELCNLTPLPGPPQSLLKIVAR